MINKTVLKLRKELTLSVGRERRLAIENSNLIDEVNKLRLYEKGSIEEIDRCENEKTALRARINEVVSFNDNCCKDNKELRKANESIPSLTNQLNKVQEERNEIAAKYSKACREFGDRMFEAGELRKPIKEVSLNIQAISQHAGVEDLKSMTLEEVRNLTARLQNILSTAK